MSELEAVEALRDAELVTVAQGNLGEIKELLGKCLDAGIPAMAAKPDEGCSTGKCGTRLHLMIRDADVTQVAQLMQRAWADLVAREGVAIDLSVPGQAAAAGDDLPCPACGTVAPLVRGACGDCGLQLE
jgi:hypothetical protein